MLEPSLEDVQLVLGEGRPLPPQLSRLVGDILEQFRVALGVLFIGVARMIAGGIC